MTDEERLFVRSYGEKSILENAFVWRGLPPSTPSPVPPLRFGWTATTRDLLRRIARKAVDTKKAEGRELPYSDLRAALQARVAGLVLLDSRIAQADDSPLFAATGDVTEIETAAHRSVAAWIQLTLRPWAENLGTDCGDIDALEEKGRRRELFARLPSPPTPEPASVPDALRSDFRQYADVLLAMAASSLEGGELFEGLGPVHRVLDREYRNSIAFETWPSALPGGDDLFSMVAIVSVETRPSSRLPFLVVKASKRIWCREFPAANRLFGRRRISVRVLARSSPARAVTLSVRLEQGLPKTQVNAIVYEAGRETGESFVEDLAALVASRGRAPDLFVGVPFRYGYRPEPKLAPGVTLQDQVDLFRKVQERIGIFGFQEPRLREVDAKIKRPKESHDQATLHNLINHHFGRVQEQDVPARVEELFGAPEKKKWGRETPAKTVPLEPLVQANRERLDRAFGKDVAIDLMFVCRREEEGRLFASVVSLIFGDRVNVVRHAMPDGVHGTRQQLDGDARNSRLKRASARKEAWLPLAERIRTEFPGAPVIVQAALKYDGKDEDEVNKSVGRNTLATVAGSNVQYLLPPAAGHAAEYMHRIQAALYDLLFGHAGLGPVPAPIVEAAFVDGPRPRTIVGISIVSQAGSRTGRPEGATIAVAMKTDVATGRISGRLGFLRNGTMDTGKFEALSKTLVAVAASGITSLGEKQPERRENFLSFVRRVVEEVVAEDPSALVLVDSTSARSLWSWLSDENISSDLYLEDVAAAPPSSWKGLRFVRVREGSAGRLSVLTERKWTPVTREGLPVPADPIEEIYATAAERLIESLPEGNARARHYLTAHGFDVRNRGARGQSVYRGKSGFQKFGAPTPADSPVGKKILMRQAQIKPWDPPSRIPVTLEVTVLPSQTGDEDAIAALVAGLRNGYAHTGDGTFLPAPLSFKSKITDYMDRYGTGAVEDEPEPDPIDDGDDRRDEDETVDASADVIGYAETRRWFEGTVDVDDDELPDIDEPEEPDETKPPLRAQAPPVILRHPEARPLVFAPGADTSIKASAMLEAVKITDPAPESPKPEQAAMELEDLVTLLRSRSAPLPGFATKQFLSNAINIVPRDTRLMHEDREWIRKATGYPWPEERPAPEDMPGLYEEALRYPAFAIVFQHQFFPDDDNRGGRGLPKNLIIVRNTDAWKRVRTKGPIPKGVAGVPSLRILHCVQQGCDKESQLAEALGLPGHDAWGARCSTATDGLEKLDAEGGEWADLAEYLRAVLGPFRQFGPERTIGEIMEEVVIPQAMKQVLTEAAPAAELPERTTPGAEPEPVVVGAALEDEAVREPLDDLAAIERTWRSECEKLAALAGAASWAGPQADGLDAIRSSMIVLQDLKDRAARLVPWMMSTSDLRENLRRLTAKAAESLTSLLGDASNAPELLSKLFDLPDEAGEADVASADHHRVEADTAMAESDAGAAEIERLEATLPRKTARAHAVAIDEDRERALRRVLEHVGAAIEVFRKKAGTDAGPPAPPREGPAVDPVAIPDEPSDVAVPEAAAHRSTELATDDAPDLGDELLLETDTAELPAASLTPTAPPVAADEVVEDPLLQEITSRLDALFAAGEFGLAYHLRRCARSVLPSSPDIYTEEELRLAAADGRAMGLSGQDVQFLTSSRSEALTVAQSLADQEDDRSIARLTMLLATAIPAALFRPDDGAAVPLIEAITTLKPFEQLRSAYTIVEENRRFNFPLTAANLMAIEAHSRESSFVSDAVASIKDTVVGLRSTKFRFQYGERVKAALLQPQGLLGRLLSNLTETSHDVAREVSEKLHRREDILRLLDAAGSEGASQEIDLQARERIFAALSRVGQQCADLVRALEGLATLRKSAQRLETVKRLRDTALAEIDAALARPRPDGPQLMAAASGHAAVILRSVRDTLKGLSSSDRNVPPLAVGLHTPLLWLPNMTWTGGWMPSPYTEERILQEIMNANIPLKGADAGAAIASAFEARRAESAFVPAYMLANIAHWFGVSEATADSLRARLDADRETKKSQVKSRLAAAERLIERMRRMAVGSLDQSARLKETLSTINPNNLPAELSPSFLPETLAGDRVEDFNSAFARIKEVENEAQREFEKTATEFTGKIAALDEQKKLDPETAVELRNLLQRREFTTLADWLNMLSSGSPRRQHLPSGTLNVRLAEFKELLPLQEFSAVDVLKAARAMDEGRSYGTLDYSHLEPEQRQQAANIARTLLPALKRYMKAASGSQVKDTLQTVVSQLLFEVTKLDPDEVLTKVKQQVYVFDAKVSLPSVDSKSLLLPEFGSLTQGSWRICVATSTTPQPALLELAEGASPRGVLLIYLGVLNPERRKNLRLELFKRKKSMLVVDEALVTVALADRSDHRRAVLEIAQGFSGADPYRDYNRSAVPPEMFKGRSWERSAIEHLFGSHIVFGGRRLGKTALLRQIHATPPANAIFAYVDVDSVVDASNAFEQMSRRIPIFTSPVRSEDEFTATIAKWLDQDERRRLLLLIDEADNFVLYESQHNFRCIRTLLRLMADTGNRFKFVLAGLHNVSRIARTENSPLVHISNNPLEIGPLLDEDVDDAEFLIRGPLAAMGFEFENREDAWRILSFTNYYPVLIQVFCEELLKIIHGRVQQTNRLPDLISTALVEQALDSADVRGKLFLTFEKTINSIEGRYELLTYILAARELVDHGSGMSAEGMTPAEVAERAIEYWPAAFPRGSDPIEIEYLLEEMEGFGIARRTYSGGFALRSRSLLELMAYDEADLTSKLEQYHKRRPERIFDPKNNRRTLAKPLPTVDSNGHLSPLTNGQEADLLAPFAPAAAVKADGSPTSPRAHGIGVVFGTELAGVRFVEAALMDAERTKDGLVEVEPRTYEAKKDLFDDAKRTSRSGRPRVIVVSSRTPWRPDWIFEAERLGRVRKGEVRIVFVGDPVHASAWSEDTAVLKRIRPQVKLARLRPVTRSYLGSRLESLQLSADLMDRILEATGGWAETAGPLLAKIAERPSQASALIEADKQALLAAPDLYVRLGIQPELVAFFRELAQYAHGSVITYRDFQHLCTDGRKIVPSVLAVYSDVLGIISFSPDQSGNRSLHKVDLNLLVLAALLKPE
ncbi:RNaseH domain-containing protein [Bradyrhizobium sp.]|uniref:RNaseH domain-containing protein n=1 Tax=Bradyrhizobium sp. TaxID=376 RepID=UPI002617E3E3|nr:RNaseH domain-containing protein [Bradyrhizobium sp.]